MRMAAQVWLIVRPACQQHHHPGICNPIQNLAEELKGCGIDPMGVLDNDKDTVLTLEPEELLD
ncbi:hypothetical protein AAII07_55770 [Microvirga sp. 0TCS3.31]